MPRRASPVAPRLVIVTAASAAYVRLRADLIRGVLTPGAKLRIREIAERYESGPIPVREALNRLAAEGLVVRSEQRGFTVAPIGAEDLHELALARAAIYEAALRESMRRGGADWEEGVLLAHHRLRKVQRYLSTKPPEPNPDYDRPHRAFHSALIAACGSRWLLRIAEQLFDHAERYRYLSRRIAVRPREDEHALIVEALLARREDEAVALLRRHVEITAEIASTGDETADAPKRRPRRAG